MVVVILVDQQNQPFVLILGAEMAAQFSTAPACFAMSDCSTCWPIL